MIKQAIFLVVTVVLLVGYAESVIRISNNFFFKSYKRQTFS